MTGHHMIQLIRAANYDTTALYVDGKKTLEAWEGEMPFEQLIRVLADQQTISFFVYYAELDEQFPAWPDFYHSLQLKP